MKIILKCLLNISDLSRQFRASVHRSDGAVLQHESSGPAEPASRLRLQLHEVRRSKTQGGGTKGAQVPGNQRYRTHSHWVKHQLAICNLTPAKLRASMSVDNSFRITFIHCFLKRVVGMEQKITSFSLPPLLTKKSCVCHH